MKRIKRAITMTMVLCLCMGTIGGCSSAKSEVLQEQKKQNAKTVTFTEYDFIKEGTSDYSIVISDSATENENFAAEEIQYFTEQATGAKLAIVKESEFKGEAGMISVGATELAEQAGVTPTYKELKNSGFQLKTDGKNCFIRGYSDIGTRNGIYEFLSYCFDYECYGIDEICVNKTDNLKMPKFDLMVNPSFDWREANAGDVLRDNTATYRMRLNNSTEIYATGSKVHNTFQFVDPLRYDYKSEEYKSWYSEKMNVQGTKPAQLCYSNADMEKVFQENLLAFLKDSEAPVMLLGMEDNVEWCTCDKCKESYNKYGTNAAVMIKFANRMQEAVNDWCAKERPGQESIKLLFFAYYETVEPPVVYDEKTDTYAPIDDSVVLHPDLGIRFAPILASYTYTFTDEKNADTARQLKGWSALTNNIHVWTYTLHTEQGLIMFNSFDIAQENYKFLIENGSTAIVDQMDHYQQHGNTGWSAAKGYLTAKLTWDVNLNQQELLDDFFANWFAEAGDIMQEIFDEEREWYAHIYQDLGVEGHIYDNLLKKEYWSKPMLEQALQKMEKAYKAIEKYQETDPERYQQLHDRICMESIQYRYILISCFGQDYETDKLLDMKNLFKHDFERLQITSYAEGNNISEVWSAWGLQ